MFKVENKFSILQNFVETQVYDEDGDFELATMLLGFFPFTDRLAVEFSLRLIRNDQVNLADLVTSLN